MASPSKSCLLDPWPTDLLKKHITTLISPITQIINLSLQEGSFIDDFKTAVITPLIKKANLDREELKNYRPVSGLNFISKIVEKVVAKQINSHMKVNELGNTYQSAYKSGHSTETALLKVQNDISGCLAQGKTAGLILLDLSAAFDTIDHNQLLERLNKSLGINGTVFRWMTSYLTHRFQSVKIKSTCSEPTPLHFGVPQGSVLGPLLFSIFTAPISNMLKAHKEISHHLYADDTQLYFTVSPDSSIFDEIRTCLNNVRVWMSDNRLKLNPDKTEYILFSSKRDYNRTSFTAMDTELRPSDQVRNLGVIFDRNFKFNKQVESISKSCRYHMRDFYRIRKYLTRDAAIKLANALVTSRIDYCNSLLGFVSERELKRLQVIQNSLARLVCKQRKFSHATPLLKSLHWLPVKYRIDYKSCLLIFKTIKFHTPSYFTQWFIPYSCSVNTRRSLVSKHFLNEVAFDRKIHKSKTCFDGIFSVRGPKLWNSLPLDLRVSESVDSFKSKLKTYFFSKAYPP